MIRLIRLLNSDGTAAVETAMFLPIFVVMTLGIADLGSGMFTRMSANAATQAGAAYAAINSGATLSNIRTAMNEAAGDSTFCTTAACAASTQADCPADPSSDCVIAISASYPWIPMLPTAAYSWAIPTTITYTTTIRVR